MTEIQYFRLSSAAKMLDASEDIIFDFAEQGLVVLSTMCRDTWGVISQGYRNGTATAVFIGYGNLSKADAIKIITKGKAEISRLSMTPHCVQAVNHKYPFEVPTPNNLFDVWQMPIPDPEKKLGFYFHIKPIETTSTKAMVDTLKRLVEPDSTASSLKSNLQLMLENKDIYAGSKVITKDELRISEQEIDKLRTLLKPKEKPLTIIGQPNRPLDKLLTRVLQQFPKEKSSKIWRMLQEDADRDKRLYDIDEILDEVGTDELYWSVGEQEPSRLTKQSFYNLVKELRESLTESS